MVEVRRLSEGELPAFLEFMDERAFLGQPQWAGCYCQFYLNTREQNEDASAKAGANRQRACDRTKSGVMQGYLAFELVDGVERAIGWMAANASVNFVALPGAQPDLAVSLAAVEIAELLGSKYVCVFTATGDSMRRVARLRSSVPTLAFTPSETVRNQLSLVWGAHSYLVSNVKHTDEMMHQVDEIVLAEGKARIGEEVVVVAGTPPGIPGSTNSLRVHRVGDAVNEAAPGYGR